MPSAWPTTIQVADFATSIGNPLPDGYDAAPELEAIIDHVTRQTGWNPFLKATEDESRIFDPPYTNLSGPMNPNGGLIIPFKAGLLEITSVVLQTRTLERGRDYWLEPSYQMPWTRLRLSVPFFAAVQSLVVTGKWGYSATIPADLWLAVRDLAVYQILSNAAASDLMSGLESFSEGDVTEKYGSKNLGDALMLRQNKLDTALRAYRRIE